LTVFLLSQVLGFGRFPFFQYSAVFFFYPPPKWSPESVFFRPPSKFRSYHSYFFFQLSAQVLGFKPPRLAFFLLAVAFISTREGRKRRFVPLDSYFPLILTTHRCFCNCPSCETHASVVRRKCFCFEVLLPVNP